METVTIQVRSPKGNDPGKVIEGFYNIIGDKVILVDRSGNPLRSDHKRYEQTFVPGENTRAIAGQMFRRYTNATRGNTPSGFDAPLRYPKLKY